MGIWLGLAVAVTLAHEDVGSMEDVSLLQMESSALDRAGTYGAQPKVASVVSEEDRPAIVQGPYRHWTHPLFD